MILCSECFSPGLSVSPGLLPICKSALFAFRDESKAVFCGNFLIQELRTMETEDRSTTSKKDVQLCLCN